MDSILEYAARRGYMGLIEGCVRVERAHFDITLDTRILENYSSDSNTRAPKMLE